METTDLTLEVLKQIRDEQRGMREEIGGLRAEMREEIGGLREEMRVSNEMHNARFEVIETTLRDLAGQMVMLARGIRNALDAKVENDVRFDDHDRRISALEQRRA